MPEPEFAPFPKIPRLNRDCVVTEKIDGTNGCIVIEDDLGVYCQSRNRIITPDDDNAGFARWVFDNLEQIIVELGPGRHFGEWWGSGIQRRYGLTGGDKRFSLFNVSRWKDTAFTVPGLGVVPVLYEGPFNSDDVNWIVGELDYYGSVAAPGYMEPEGVIVYHTASRHMFKVTCHDDEKPKGQA